MKKLLTLLLFVPLFVQGQQAFYGTRQFVSLDGADTLELSYKQDTIFFSSTDSVYFEKLMNSTGGTVSFGTNGQIAFTNPAGTDFEYSPNFIYKNDSNSFTAGYRIGTIGINSVVMGGDVGYENEASGSNSTAFGRSTTASGGSSTAFGNSTTASGDYSTAFGRNITASGNYSIAFGYNIAASNLNSTAFGRSTTASGGSSTAFGNSTTASGDYSTAFGRSTTASGRYSTVFGYNTIAHDYLETTLGQYNIIGTGSAISYVNTDNLFTIGNGASDTERSNAFQIKKNGNTTIFGGLEVSTTTDAFIVPRMTTTERDALVGVNGMIIYNTTTNQFNFYENGSWVTK